MEARDILIKPIVTEKTMKQQSDLNQVTFYVKKGVNKIEIAKAVEEIYNVKVTSVNVIVTPEKKKRVGRYYGRTTEKRKAIVTLAEGDSITLF
ncbi:MAG: 50S ribosomal protein L23 [Erysipelotrichales bacterium]|nr:50S ribosomal protein L23 [Erysipelotrichales bacterium]MBQ1386352.1 50S ribosomal protein L23 [Erysipelotrichales bacterium]MBQ2309068.1 50S ribosomal protein L23 [Erysipelotrichales bacterium]MBQ2477951.1 50S ribosomal protein L23 [Erysipelotrichales bacterium]MBQ4375240.1 50S ribosomal protein L23 [Erysipelotrichales bacterium]